MRKKKPRGQQVRKREQNLDKPTIQDILDSQVGRGVIYPIVDEQSGKPTGLFITMHRKPLRNPTMGYRRDGTKFTRESEGKRRGRNRARNRVARAERRRQRRDHR